MCILPTFCILEVSIQSSLFHYITIFIPSQPDFIFTSRPLNLVSNMFHLCSHSLKNLRPPSSRLDRIFSSSSTLSHVLIRFSQFYSFSLLLFASRKILLLFSLHCRPPQNDLGVNENSIWLHEIFLLVRTTWTQRECVNKYIVIIFLFDTYKNNFLSSPYYYVFNTKMIASVKKRVEIFNNTNNTTFMLLNKFPFHFRYRFLTQFPSSAGRRCHQINMKKQ